MAAVVAVCYAVIFRWHLPEYNRLQADIDVLEQEVVQLNSSIATVTQLEKKLAVNIASLEREMDRFNWRVFQGEPVLLLKDQEVNQQLRFTSFNHGTTTLVGSIWEVTFVTAAKGTYEAIYYLLQHLDNQEKALQIRNIKLEFPYSFEFKPRDEIYLQMELAAYGAAEYQGKVELDSMWLEGRDNIFEPTVNFPGADFPAKPAERLEKPVNNNQSGADKQEVTNSPSYNFPTEEELNQWKLR
jgi:hypothetical protein